MEVAEIKPHHLHVLCVDSDGCVMNTMTIKHEKYFGPLVTKYFNVADEDQFLKQWNNINLYSKTRGINRFVALAKVLKMSQVSGIDHLEKWVAMTKEYSNRSLQQAIEENSDAQDLKKALEWSNAVNDGIAKESHHFKPFKEAAKALNALKDMVDIAIVSSANKTAVLNEWENNEILKDVDIIFGQEDGKKEDCLKKLCSAYHSDSIMMVGDAMGDYQAAKTNDVLFYPILVNHEDQSWDLLRQQAINEFLNGKYDQQTYYDSFMNNFDEVMKK